MKARVHVTLKQGVLDPQGKAIANALHALGFDSVIGVRQGKFLELDLKDADTASAEKSMRSMCERLLANTVIEDYAFEVWK
ncbi:MAG: phosphoribosylformylglycinamidine synthase subunit PurS [Alphaproteobacteria bacterium]|nr:phosphoribosylformylglycinamidine synthase subunit PurS [Alphaproteobacteria bacterium]